MLQAFKRRVIKGWSPVADPPKDPAAGTWPIEPGKQRIERQFKPQAADIYGLSGVSPASFDALYAPALGAVADYAQGLPGSEFHHHSHPGGLLKHILETVIYGLRLRKGHLLPSGCPPEQLQKLADRYTYALFCGALCHDIAKPAVDVEVTLYANNQSIGRWDPYGGPMTAVPDATHYTYHYQPARQYRLHVLAAPLFVSRIVPARGLQWLASDQALFDKFLCYVSGRESESGEIGEIVGQGDQTSVSVSLGAQTIPGTRSRSHVPLHEKLRTALRLVLQSEGTVLNKPGALAWYDGTDFWAMSKGLADQVREQLTGEGHTGVPGDNSRLFTIMIEHGLIRPRKGHRAIWKVRIELDDWKPASTFSVIRIPREVAWPNETTCPEPINGQGIMLTEATPEVEQPDRAEADSKSVDETAPPNDRGDVPLRASDPGETHHMPELDADAKPSGTELSTSQAVATALPDHPGTRFLIWLRQGIRSGSIRYNGSKHPVHIIDQGVFLVSPAIFKVYAQSVDATQWETLWEGIQKSFQGLKLNLKSRRGENFHTVRVESRQNKPSRLQGWIVPVEEVFTDGQRPPVNTHLTLINQPLSA